MRLRMAALGLSATLAAGLLAVPPALATPTEAPVAHGDQVSTSGDLLLTWDGVAGAAGYKVDISADESFTTILETATTTSRVYAPVLPMVGGTTRTLYWRVAAYDTTVAAIGPFSDTQSVDRAGTAGPVLTSPADTSTVAYPTPLVLRWDAVPSAYRYTVEYSLDDSFSSVTSATVFGTSFAPTTLPARGTWYWRVRADLTSTAGALQSAYSSVFSFVLAWPSAASKPTLITPAEGATMSDVEFSWSPVAGAASYQIDIALDEAFTSTVVAGLAVIGTRYVPDVQLANSPYWWRVRAIDTHGQPGVVSDVGSFVRAWGPQSSDVVTDPGLLAAPRGASTYPVPDVADQTLPLDKINLSWAPVARATAYEVQIVEGASFNVPSEKIQGCITSSTSVTPFQDYAAGAQAAARLTFVKPACLTDSTKDFALTSGSTYRWRVRALDLPASSSASYQIGTTLNSQWSDPQTTIEGAELPSTPAQFTLAAPTAPATGDGSFALTSPPSGATDVRQAPLLQWTASSAASKGYKVEIALDASFTTGVAQFWTDSTQLRPNGFLNDNTTNEKYYWRVSACDSLSSGTKPSLTNVVCGVQYAANFNKISTPVALDPASVESNVDVVHLEWQPVATAAAVHDGGIRGYHVQVSALEDFSTTALDLKLDSPQTALTISGRPLGLGTWYYRVQTVDAGKTSGGWSPIGSFVRTMAVPTVAPTASASVPVLSWTPVANAKSYQLQWWQDGGGASGTQATGLEQAVFAPTTGTAFLPGTYHWRVQIKDAANRLSSWSPDGSFVISAPQPSLTTPDGSALGVDEQVLSWQPIPGAFRYKVTYSLSPSFTSPTTLTTAQPLLTPVNLVYGQPYYWRVQALSSGSAVLSTSATGTFSALTLPGKVSGVKATINGTSATIQWTALAGAGRGAAALDYLLRKRAQPDGEWVVIGPLSSTTTSFAENGLDVGTTYEFQVSATNSQGQGIWSSSVMVTTPSAPSVPQGLSVSPTLNGLRVAWLAPASPGGTIAHYVVRYRTDDAAPWTSTTTIARSIGLTGLTGGLLYNVEVAAVNVVGEGPSAASSGIPITGPGAPGKPVVKNGDKRVALTWTAPTTTGSVELSGYEIGKRTYTPSTKTWGAWVPVLTVGPTAHTGMVTGLANGGTYEFRVSATTALGNGTPSLSSVGKPAAKPTAVKPLLKAVIGKITVSWAAAATNGSVVSGYVIQRSTDNKTWGTLVTTKSTARAWTWTKGTKGKKYFFRIGVKSNFPIVWGPSAFTTAR